MFLPFLIRPSPFFLNLASNVFSDIGSVGRIENNRITRRLRMGGPGTGV